MNKELEALRVLKANAILFDDGTDFGASMLEAISELDKYLTPPTADEVCEALSEYLKEPIKYVRTSFVNERETAEVCGLFGLDNYDLVDFNTPLPPRLITLIGRFYEGLEELK